MVHFGSISSTCTLFVVIILQSCVIQKTTVLGFSLISDKTTSNLLEQNKDMISKLKNEASNIVDITSEPYSNDVFFLRYCISDEDNDDDDEISSLLKENLKWRTGDGKDVCDRAQKAITEATSEGGGWNNEPVRDNAPHSSIINQYITPSQALTTTSGSKYNDLVFIVRAGKINDAELMSSLDGDNVQKMVDFFLYCKEVNACVANSRSLTNDNLCALITTNDLSGIKLVGGSADFRKALSESSKIASTLYPNLAGPTLLVNLPKLLGAIVKLFTPLFPDSVRKKLRFEQGFPLVDNLVNVASSKDDDSGSGDRKEFLSSLNNLVY